MITSCFVAAIDPVLKPFAALAVLAILSLIVWGVVRIVRRTRADNAAWDALVAELGLRQVGEDDWAADVDGLALSIATVRRKTRKSSTYETHVTIGKVPDAVHLGGEGFVANLMEHGITRVAGPDIETGDAAFDEAVKVKGDEAAALALLDAEARELLRRAIKDKWFVADGQVRHITYANLSDARTHVLLGLDVARLVRAKSGSVDARLMSRLHDDPIATVRRRVLGMLVAHGHNDGPWLISLTGVEHPAEVRAAALDAITAHVPDHDQESLTHALALSVGWASDPDTDLRRASLHAIARFAPPDAEDIFLAALADPDDAVQLAAVRGLATLGTVRAVPALAPLRERLIGSPLTRAAEAAIATIQARVGPTGRGGLALADHDEGGLALAPEPTRD